MLRGPQSECFRAYWRRRSILTIISQYKPGPGFTFDFLQFEPGSETEVIETDVVIVGSGCGGAVCAKNLAEAGNRVLVVDKSYYFRPEQLPLSEETGLNHVLESGGALVSDDGSVSIAAASVWGGGGTVNWSASLQTQNFVRKEWAQDRGLKFFETAEYQSCLDRVCHRMGVSADHIRQNHGNRVLLEGARKLGYHAKAVPQNTGGKEHYCGHCCLGCGSNEKQGPVMTWLPDAANAGAKFVEGFKVDRVLFDKSNTTKAIGIKGVWTSRNSKGGLDGPISERTVRKVVVKAKKVIISSGTLWSPIILLKSGLKVSYVLRDMLNQANISRTITSGEISIFTQSISSQLSSMRRLSLGKVAISDTPNRKPTNCHAGGILTTVCTSFENLDGHGHGAKLETTAMVPSMFLVYKNWVDGLSWKTDALKIRNMNGFISIARDRDGGRIYPDPNSGSPRIQYTPSTFDRGHCMEGLLALAKMAYVSGATEIHPFLQGLQPFLRDAGDTPSEPAVADEPDPGVTDARFGAWLAEIERIGNKPPTGTFTSAHQMGTNRMSVRARDGVVDPKGKVWGTEGLYVSDASIFPSASGVNPMITNMAISDWISTNIAKEMRYGGLAMESRL